MTMARPHLEYIDYCSVKKSRKYNEVGYKLQERALRRIKHCNDPEKRKKYDELSRKYNIESLNVHRKRNL